MRIPNIYLDIDGVLLSEGKSSESAEAFLQYLEENFPDNLYWLSTRCSGDATQTYEQIRHYFSEYTQSILKGIKPTSWNVLKTDAINFDEAFLWFDDNLMVSERNILLKNNAENNHIKIDLRSNRYQLRDITYDFPLPFAP